MLLRTSLATILSAVLTFSLTAAHAHGWTMPNWCKTLGGEVAANSPSCQEPAGPCHDMEVEAGQLAGSWSIGRKYLQRQRYNRPITVRDSNALRAVSSTSHAQSMISRAESRFPQIIDRSIAHGCDLRQIGLDRSYGHPVLRAMVDDGRLTWDRWSQWVER